MIATKRNSIAAALVVFSAAMVAASGAPAQTASNLQCKGCVGKTDLGKKAVRKKHIKKNSVAEKALRDGSVSERTIQSGAVQPGHLADAAKPAGVEYDYPGSPSGDVTIDMNGKVVNSIGLTLPGPGYVVVNADYNIFDQFADSNATCVIRVNGEIAGDVEGKHATAPQSIYVPVAMTRTHPVDTAGQVAIVLFCASKGATPKIKNASLTALFVPNHY